MRCLSRPEPLCNLDEAWDIWRKISGDERSTNMIKCGVEPGGEIELRHERLVRGGEIDMSNDR